MASIRFSHIYSKLLCCDVTIAKKATLLQVISINHEQLSREFVDYDTDNGKYKLAYDTLYIMLIFLKKDGHIFTTLRPQFGMYGDKFKYYHGLIGKEFDLILNPPSHA